MIYTSIQKQILQKLLTKYESSKTYKGENSVSQSFSIKPSDVFKDYEKDSADISAVEDFEKQCKLLESAELINLDYRYDRIIKITAIGTEKGWNQYRTILEVKDKKTRLSEEIDFYSKYLDSNEIISDICKEQIERLQLGKEAKYEHSEAQKIIDLLSFILGNKEEILERELSIAVLHDSKLWEKKYKSRVCKILIEKGNFSELIHNADEKEINKIILEQFNIFDNPTYVYFKGDAAIQFSNGNIINVTLDNPIAFSSVSLGNIKNVEIRNSKVMTVENLTSFNRIKQEAYCYIYLSGYHNSAKQDFLKLIYEHNKDKDYYHFGDIDPDGFFILENLKTKTSIPFKSYKMSVQELEQYSAYIKPLEQNDITKANSLSSKGLYLDEVNHMLKNNCKLEQEIISWLEN